VAAGWASVVGSVCGSLVGIISGGLVAGKTSVGAGWGVGEFCALKWALMVAAAAVSMAPVIPGILVGAWVGKPGMGKVQADSNKLIKMNTAIPFRIRFVRWVSIALLLNLYMHFQDSD